LRTDAHISQSRTEVRRGTLARHRGRRFPPGQVFALTSGLGLPRTWSLATDAALQGFAEGLDAAATARGLERLKSGLGRARTLLARRCDHLVERMLPDASLVALTIEDGELHVLSVGPGRVYLQRTGRPRRLTSREEPVGGLLHARPSQCSIPVERGDLLLAGSLTAFSMSSIAKAVSVLHGAPQTPPGVVAQLLTEPAGKAGVGAVAAVLRVL
jgi:hypothetical protein